MWITKEGIFSVNRYRRWHFNCQYGTVRIYHKNCNFSLNLFFNTWSVPAFIPFPLSLCVCGCDVDVARFSPLKYAPPLHLVFVVFASLAIHRSSSSRALTELKLKKCNKSAFETQVDFPVPFCPSLSLLARLLLPSWWVILHTHRESLSRSSSSFHPRQAL